MLTLQVRVEAIYLSFQTVSPLLGIFFCLRAALRHFTRFFFIAKTLKLVIVLEPCRQPVAIFEIINIVCFSILCFLKGITCILCALINLLSYLPLGCKY